jgi:ribonuclease BN (tRNA processing enzyme)
MELTIVGCSGSISGRGSAASSYLVQAPHEGRMFSLVLDLGPGALGALHNYLQPRHVDALGLSHLHPDHCLDVCGYYVLMKHGGGERWPRRRIYGPPDSAARLARAYGVTEDEASDLSAGIATDFDYATWQPEQRIGPFDVRTARVAHPVEAYAVRVEERRTGGSLVYSGDTGPCGALTELASGASLLLVEAAFMDQPGNQADLHLNGREAAQCGRAAGVGRVVLTHIPPWHSPQDVLSEAKPHFDGPIELAEPGARWTVGERR